MSQPAQFPHGIICRESAVFTGAVTLPANAVPLGGGVPSGLLPAANSISRFERGRQLFHPTESVIALTTTFPRAYAAETLIEFAAWIEVVATGADRTITVDLQKSTGAGAYATILSATIGFTNVSAVRTMVVGTFSNTALVAGNILRTVVTVAGAAGAQATGLSVSILSNANPQ